MDDDHFGSWQRITTDRYWKELQSRPPRVIRALLALLHRKPVWEVDDAATDKER